MQETKLKNLTSKVLEPSFNAKRCYLAVILLTLGVAVLMMSGIVGDEAISPGKVSSAHSTVQSCGQCHASMENGFESMVSTLIDSDTPIRNSQLCIKCHAFGDSAFDPHGLSPKILNNLATKKAAHNKDTVASTQAPLTIHAANYMNAYKKDKQLPCTACHKEHKEESTAQAVKIAGDEFCQSCHNAPFETFVQGHPEFSHYPYQKTPNFKFSHGEHFVKHFTDDKYQKNAKQSCNDCHIMRQNENVKLASFDATCVDCHSKRIQGGNGDKNSVAFIALPGLDIETLLDANIDIGYWPEYAEAELTPFMHLLLLSDPRYQQISDQLSDVDLLDLSDEDDTVIAVVAELAWSVKRLLHNLAFKEGVLGMATQFEQVFNRSLSVQERANLSAMLSADSLKISLQAWLPNIVNEIEEYNLGNIAQTTVEQQIQLLQDDNDMPRIEGWYRSEYTLYYKLTGHNDSFVKAWLDFTVNHPMGMSLAVEKVLYALSDKKSPGGCLKCHSISRDQNNKRKIQWTANIGDFDNVLTQFNHQPHFKLMGDQECAVCHQVEKKEDKVNFKPLAKAVCGDCHNSTNVSQSCTTCHKYHGSEAVHNIKAKL